MIRRMLAVALAMLLPAAAHAAPTISGCGTTSIPKVDLTNPAKLLAQSNCFGEAEVLAKNAKQARLDRIAALPPAGPPFFTTAQRAALLWPVAVAPSSGPDDPIGAFRMICSPGHADYNDAIVFPGLVGGSPHLHRYYGNTRTAAGSTHDTLLIAGDSTCSNALNRSAYWVPAMITGDGKSEIIPDWISLYYKRIPASDPNCFKIAAKGCVGIPNGLRIISGYDMKRMGQAQPENMTFSHRCTTEGKPSIHRKLLSEAIADCGGSGTILSAVNFGECWNGQLDSPDHRSHLTFQQWDQGASGTPWPGPCPKTHPYLIPQLTQGLQYTIEKGDGAVYFASDRMNGMDMPGGTSLHADYIEAWDEPTRKAWEANCIDRKLNCSDGDLGNGTQMKRPPLVLKAVPRLLPALARPTT